MALTGLLNCQGGRAQKPFLQKNTFILKGRLPSVIFHNQMSQTIQKAGKGQEKQCYDYIKKRMKIRDAAFGNRILPKRNPYRILNTVNGQKKNYRSYHIKA